MRLHKTLLFIFCIIFLNTPLEASEIFKLDMQRCSAFLQTLQETPELEARSKIIPIFEPVKLDEKLDEEAIRSKIPGWVKGDFFRTKQKISEKSGKALELWKSQTFADIIETVSAFIDGDHFSAQERQDILKVLIDSHAKHVQETEEKIRNYYDLLKEGLYPKNLWFAYIARLILGINLEREGTEYHRGGDFGFFNELEFTADFRQQLWQMMLDSKFVQSSILDVTKFQYCPAQAITRTWAVKHPDSFVIGCGRFNRHRLKVLGDLKLDSKIPMNCGICDKEHTGKELLINVDPTQVPDVIADALYAPTWSGFQDNTLKQIIDETGHSIFLNTPDSLKAIVPKLVPGGSILTKFSALDYRVQTEGAYIKAVDEVQAIVGKYGISKVELVSTKHDWGNSYQYRLIK